jgi:cytoskeleton protein RodZ
MEPPEARETPPGMAGALLRAARESAGMTIDAVAQHLKLAPRQVKAIEDGDYAELPGRTFTRGFVRNYARLVHLDPERVVSALPAGASAPALEAPTLSPTTHTIGELPTTERARMPRARWVIPVVLAAIVAAAAVYEWMRPAGESRLAGAATELHGAAQKDASPHAGGPATPTATMAASTPLPNPVASNAPGSDGAQSSIQDSSGTTVPPQPTAGGGAPAPLDASATPPATATGTAATPPGAPASVAAAPTGEQTVVVAFRSNSWTEIRDRDGRVLITGLNRAGTAQTVTGAPPFTIKIGNANDVTLRYRGERVDLAPYTQKNVARLTLQ